MRITNTLVKNKLFATEVRGHTILVDQPVENGGDDQGPTPPEIFVTALGTCVGVYAISFCEKHHIPTDGLTVHTDWEKGTGPTRIAGMTVTIALPAGIPADKYQAFMRTVEQCLIHNTLTHTPEVHIALVEPATPV